MKAGGGGSVVLIGSQSMFQPALPQSGYAASKSALLSAMYYLVDELGPDNIRCNMVIPSWMWGPNVEMYVTGTAKQPGRSPGRGPRGHRRQVPAAADDRGRRGGRRGRLLRLRPRQGGDRAVPAGQLRGDAAMSDADPSGWWSGAPASWARWSSPRCVRHPGLRAGRGGGQQSGQGRAATSASICGIGPVGRGGHRRHRRPGRPPARRPGPLRADRGPRRRQHPGHRRLPAGRHRRVLDGHDPVGVADHVPQPAELDRPHHRGLRGGRRVLLHHRHRPRLRQRPLPDDPDGAVRRGPPGPGPRDPRLHQLRGRLRGRDGHRPAARVRPAARAHRHPGHVVGGHGADDGPRRRHRARRDHHHLGEVGHRQARSPRPRA